MTESGGHERTETPRLSARFRLRFDIIYLGSQSARPGIAHNFPVSFDVYRNAKIEATSTPLRIVVVRKKSNGVFFQLPCVAAAAWELQRVVQTWYKAFFQLIEENNLFATSAFAKSAVRELTHTQGYIYICIYRLILMFRSKSDRVYIYSLCTLRLRLSLRLHLCLYILSTVISKSRPDLRMSKV